MDELFPREQVIPCLPPPPSRKKGSPVFLLLAHLMKGVEERGVGKDDITQIPKCNRKETKLRPGMNLPHASEPPPRQEETTFLSQRQQHQKRGWEQVTGDPASS